ncbi:hypothetical protein J6590_059911 [Homalodisca vitripennis]|nr:hypothetical protein J6590_059911 [Homalodisca vitripennis]
MKLRAKFRSRDIMRRDRHTYIYDNFPVHRVIDFANVVIGSKCYKRPNASIHVNPERHIVMYEGGLRPAAHLQALCYPGRQCTCRRYLACSRRHSHLSSS